MPKILKRKVQTEIRLLLKGLSDHGVHSGCVCLQSASILGSIAGGGGGGGGLFQNWGGEAGVRIDAP